MIWGVDVDMVDGGDEEYFAKGIHKFKYKYTRNLLVDFNNYQDMFTEE